MEGTSKPFVYDKMTVINSVLYNNGAIFKPSSYIFPDISSYDFLLRFLILVHPSEDISVICLTFLIRAPFKTLYVLTVNSSNSPLFEIEAVVRIARIFLMELKINFNGVLMG